VRGVAGAPTVSAESAEEPVAAAAAPAPAPNCACGAGAPATAAAAAPGPATREGGRTGILRLRSAMSCCSEGFSCG